MKQKIIFSVLVISLIIPLSPFSSAQVYNEDYSKLQKLNLYKGNRVWMVYGWTFLYPKGVQEKKGKKTSFERFDKDGNRTEENTYDSKGEITYSCQYLFDESGNEIKKMGGLGEDVVYDKWVYTTVDNGAKIERRSEYKKGKDQKWVYTLDVYKNRTDETYYDVNGTISYKWLFEYDSHQNVTEKKELDGYNNVYQRWEYKYDDKNNNIETYHYVSNNVLQNSYQMKYDKKGNLKSKFTLDKDGKIVDLTVYVFQFYDGLHAPNIVGNKK